MTVYKGFTFFRRSHLSYSLELMELLLAVVGIEIYLHRRTEGKGWGGGVTVLAHPPFGYFVRINADISQFSPPYKSPPPNEFLYTPLCTIIFINPLLLFPTY